jgi:hypothetical protein
VEKWLSHFPVTEKIAGSTPVILVSHVRLLDRSPAFQAGRHGFESHTWYCHSQNTVEFSSCGSSKTGSVYPPLRAGRVDPFERPLWVKMDKRYSGAFRPQPGLSSPSNPNWGRAVIKPVGEPDNHWPQSRTVSVAVCTAPCHGASGEFESRTVRKKRTC